MTKREPPTVTAITCGTKVCIDGLPHDDLQMVVLKNESGEEIGGSVACSRCGRTAFDRDMMELP